MKKNIIIVADKKNDLYAELFLALISERNDTESFIYSTKKYEDNKTNIGSSIPLIFIGESKTTNKFKDIMNVKFNKFGCMYAWRGNRAMIWTEEIIFVDPLYLKEFKDFYEATCKDKKNIKNLTCIPIATTVPVHSLKVMAKLQYQKPQYFIAIFSFINDGFDLFLNKK